MVHIVYLSFACIPTTRSLVRGVSRVGWCVMGYTIIHMILVYLFRDRKVVVGEKGLYNFLV